MIKIVSQDAGVACSAKRKDHRRAELLVRVVRNNGSLDDLEIGTRALGRLGISRSSKELKAAGLIEVQQYR